MKRKKSLNNLNSSLEKNRKHNEILLKLSGCPDSGKSIILKRITDMLINMRGVDSIIFDPREEHKVIICTNKTL